MLFVGYIRYGMKRFRVWLGMHKTLGWSTDIVKIGKKKTKISVQSKGELGVRD